jgi:drug/metabolite transporter (DMT)-like permease
MNNLRGILFTILSASLYGIMPIWVKLAYTTGLTAFDVTFLRFIMAAAMLAIFIFYRKISFRIERKQLVSLLWTTMSFTGASLFLYLSYHYVSAGVSTSLHYTFPVLVMLIAYYKYHEKLELYKWLALLTSVAGIYLIAEPWGRSFSIPGVSLALISALFMAVYVLSINHDRLKEMDSLVQAFYSCLTASFVSLVLITVQGNWPPAITLEGLYYTGLVSFFCTALALIFFIKGVQSIGSANASILSTMEPVVSFAAGIIILLEPLTWYTSLGCILIVMAVILIGYIDQVKFASRSKKQKSAMTGADSANSGIILDPEKKSSNY